MESNNRILFQNDRAKKYKIQVQSLTTNCNGFELHRRCNSKTAVFSPKG